MIDDWLDQKLIEMMSVEEKIKMRRRIRQLSAKKKKIREKERKITRLSNELQNLQTGRYGPVCWNIMRYSKE